MTDKGNIGEKLRKEMEKIPKDSKILRPEPWPADLIPEPEPKPEFKPKPEQKTKV